MNEHHLIIFDIDGTLADRDTGALLPGVYEWFEKNKQLFNIAFATNQGGVGLRYWMETGDFGDPEKFPTELIVCENIDRVLFHIFGTAELTTKAWDNVYMAFAYRSKKSGKWSPGPPPAPPRDYRGTPRWRNPGPGMLTAAMNDQDILPVNTLMVGDRPEDEEAAAAAGVSFLWAYEFFGRKK